MNKVIQFPVNPTTPKVLVTRREFFRVYWRVGRLRWQVGARISPFRCFYWLIRDGEPWYLVRVLILGPDRA